MTVLRKSLPAKRTFLLCTQLFCTQLIGILILGVSAASGAESNAETIEYPTTPLFGDTHLHSSWSTDAGMGGASLGPEVAYRASRGERVTSHTGLSFQLDRPLDFVVLADHAENLGLADYLRRSDPLALNNPTGKRWHDWLKDGQGIRAFQEWLMNDNVDMIKEPAMAIDAWTRSTTMADDFYEPGKFTTLHGFEWTSHPGGNNIHRVVVFRDDKRRTQQIVPYSQFDSTDPEDLWQFLADYERDTEGRVLAIPHNSNLSNGLMFATRRMGTKGALTKDYADQRMRFEPLVEVTQIKGTSEAHPLLSPDDQFADYELLDIANISGKAAKEEWMLSGEYVRSAMKNGLAIEQDLGSNPFQFGVIGSTDAHTSLPSPREDNFFGKAHIAEPGKDRINGVLIQGAIPELSMHIRDLGASGLAAVWASENTREAIWDAMARREVYATTGSRMTVRLFAGWSFSEADLASPDRIALGYQKGVPMGGVLKGTDNQKPLTIMVSAASDPLGAHLDRIQIVKGWVDETGATHERIFDVAVSDGREISEVGRANAAVGSTVDLTTATYENTIGDAMLSALWTDPDFDPKQAAFYYARVMEIPTPRWNAYDRVRYGATSQVPVTEVVQDRAYTSAVWYQPSE